MKILRSKTYNDMLEKMRKQESKLEHMEESILEKNQEIAHYRKKLKDPRACETNEGSDFCKCCKYSYEYNKGSDIFPCYRTGCTLTVTCEDFDLKED